MKQFAMIVGSILAALTIAACDAPAEGNDSPVESSEVPSVGVNTNGEPIIKGGGGTVIDENGVGIEVGGGYYVTPDGEVDFGFP